MKYVYFLLCAIGCLINTKSYAQMLPVDTTKQVLTMPEEMPQFPGGENEMYSFISKNLYYPTLAKENAIEGKVYVRFVVERDGSIDQIEILKKLGWGCDEEVIRMIQLMPKWKPGKMKGNAVPVFFVLPVVFKLK
ncbi:MAG: energy transducer TonB [Bacteroidota bacterium]